MSERGPIGLLLAGGRGKRFDPTGRHDKLLAPLPDGTPVAVASARNLQSVVPHVVAIVRPDAPALAAALTEAGCDVHTCAQAACGMGRVLAYGVERTFTANGWIVALADMPFVESTTLRRIVEALATHERVAPYFQGQRGHPVGFRASMRTALVALDGDRGARDLLVPLLHRIDVDDPGVLRDVDTPADLTTEITSGFSSFAAREQP